jgi:hypothetical protein
MLPIELIKHAVKCFSSLKGNHVEAFLFRRHPWYHAVVNQYKIISKRRTPLSPCLLSKALRNTNIRHPGRLVTAAEEKGRKFGGQNTEASCSWWHTCVLRQHSLSVVLGRWNNHEDKALATAA